MSYIAISYLWHSKEQRTIDRGEIVTLDHLSQDQIAAVMKVGGVVPLEDIAPLLTLPGVGQAQAIALIQATGAWSLEKVEKLPVEALAAALKIGPAEAEKIQAAARAILTSPLPTAADAPTDTAKPATRRMKASEVKHGDIGSAEHQ